MNLPMRFLRSHPGKGTIGVCLANLLIVWPDALSWLVAAGLLCWATGHLRQAFRSLDGDSRPSCVTLRPDPPPVPRLRGGRLCGAETATDISIQSGGIQCSTHGSAT
jgi:hypothetical protein